MNGIYDALQTENIKGKTLIKIQLQPERTANEVLAMLLPHVTIHRLDEVIPTMNDIFIDKVKRQDYE